MNDQLKILNFINGQSVEAVGGNWLVNINPADGSTIGQITSSDAGDVELAVAAGTAAFEGWANTSLELRCSILLRVGDLIEENLESLSLAESEDSGKPLQRARTLEIPRAAANFRFFGSAITQFASESHESVGLNAFNFTLRQPLGVVGCISPWNLPLYLFTWKIAPALAAGNCVIAKPSELTPRTAWMLGEICNAAGLPPGVLNILQGTGAGAGQAILEHAGIKAISFTGGTTTGQQVAQTVAPQFKKLSLELGGKNPNIIFADCDYERALVTTVQSSFANSGQICLCGSRIFVQSSIYERFKTDLVEKTSSLQVGHPTLSDAPIGAMISSDHYQKVLGYLNTVDREHATVLCGGGPASVPGFADGFYLQPTVIEVNSNRCRLNQEEIFGPVVTLMPFDTEAQLTEWANDVQFGLSATIWTRDLDRAMRLARNIDCGVIWINTWLMRDLRTPFGGMKNSGVGREGGLEALRFFTEPKNVCIAFEPGLEPGSGRND